MLTEIKVVENVKQSDLERTLQAHYIEGWRIETMQAQFTYAMFIIVLARDTATREEFEAHIQAMNSDQVNDAYRNDRGLPNGDGFTPTTGDYAEGYKAWAERRNGAPSDYEAGSA